jgi:3-oxoacyl-[acyl-carrier-protein] synthase-3
LLITAETYSKYINSLDKSNKTIFGDGASAAIISKNNIGISGAIKKFSFYTDGFGYDKLIVKNGGLRNKNGRGLDVFDEDGNFIYNDSNLFMDGKAIFDFTAFNVPRIVDSIIIKNDLTIGDIDLFIFHQANIFMIDFIRKRCKIPEEKFFIFVENCANTVSSTIPIAIKEAIGQNRIQRGSKVLLIGFGVGLSIAGTIVDY